MLSDEQIDALWRGKDLSVPQIVNRRELARTIEAEVRKDDESLIRQMLEALEKSNLKWKELADSGDTGYWKAEEQEHYQQSEAAITAARAHLLESDLSTLTERGAKAWAGVDPQKLREGGAL
ncbi:hypothetical protein [Acidovorax sp. Leaf73]|uniref:hypothetical protein n=1 Tax=Acidovorax sp. Leaf73 TaxID=2876566 RepID=UPI001E4AC09D|nr:hypothetical protein [Acidovorax sp. Leaf73]